VKILILAGLLMVQGAAPLQTQNGVITGRILSTGGPPAAGVRVAAQIARDSTAPAAGPVVFASIGETDGNGIYRLVNLPPGRYQIAAGLINLPTYYPGSPDLAAATVVVVRAGATLAGMNFTLARSAGVTVSGRVSGVSTSGTPVGLPLRVRMISTSAPSSMETAVKPDGSFEFQRVSPGTYSAQVFPANFAPGAKSIVVGSVDVTGVEFKGPLLVQGRVVLDSGVFRRDAASTPILRMEALGTGTNGPVAIAPIRPDGSFTFSLKPGAYSIAITGHRFGVYRKSIMYASTDLLRAPLVLTDSASAEIIVTLTTARPEAEPAAVTASGRVLNVPSGGTPGPLSIVMAGTLTDGTPAGGEVPLRADATFEFLNVPPGSFAARVAGMGVDSGQSVTVTVGDKDVTGIALAMTLRLKVSGNIKVIGTDGRTLTDLPADAAIYFRNGRSFNLTAVGNGGAFSTELPEGEYAVSFRLPAGYSTKSISFGAIDLVKDPLRVASPGMPAGILGTLEFRGVTTPR
jgi:hypothetical protein